MTRQLAAAGHRAIGVDISAEELMHARHLAAEGKLDVQFVAGDMRDLPDVGPVDGILCWGNSFGYLMPEDTARSFVAMRKLLRSDRRLVVESYAFAESILASAIEPEDEYEYGGIRMKKKNHYRVEESRVDVDYVFENDAGVIERTQSAYYVHTIGEIVRLLKAAGFRKVELRGQDGTSPFRLGSPRLIAIATA
jgi:hypothetical protein